MSKHHGQFFWYDLMASDTKAAETFYHDVLGWDAKDSGSPDHDYRGRGSRQCSSRPADRLHRSRRQTARATVSAPPAIQPTRSSRKQTLCSDTSIPQ